MVASDRVSAFDVIMAEPIADKGRVLTAMTTFWCEEMADVVPGSQLAVDPAEIEDALGGAALPAELGRAGRRWCGAPRCSSSSASCGATWPGRPTRSTSGRGRCTARPCRRACSWPAGWPSRSSPPRPRRPRGTTSTSTSPPPSTWWAPRRPRAARDICLELYRRAAARARRAPASCWPTPSSSWATSTACSACATRCARRTRRAAGRPTRWCRARRRPPSTSSPCATGWRRSPGTARRPRRRCPPR